MSRPTQLPMQHTDTDGDTVVISSDTKMKDAVATEVQQVERTDMVTAMDTAHADVATRRFLSKEEEKH